MVTVADPAGHSMTEKVTGIAVAASMPGAAVLQRFGTSGDAGLSLDEVTRRRGRYGPNAVSSHRARFLPVLWHQLKSPLLGLLMSAAVASYFVGERSDAVIIA